MMMCSAWSKLVWLTRTSIAERALLSTRRREQGLQGVDLIEGGQVGMAFE
jgi:hypothetical protein